INTASYVTPIRIRKSSVVRRRPQASTDYVEVHPELAQIPVASPLPTAESDFTLPTPTIIRSSRVIPRQRLTSTVIQPTLPQYLFESSTVEDLLASDPKRKVKVYQSRESVVTSVHSGQVDATLLSQISNGYLDGSTVPVITKTRGLATTIVNLQSRLHITSDPEPVSRIVATPLANTAPATPVFELDQLENIRKTVYVLQTFMYTVVDETGQTHTSSKTEIKSSILATPTALLKDAVTEDVSISNGYLALDNTRKVNLANDVRNGKTTRVDLSLRTVVKLDNVGDAIIRTQQPTLSTWSASEIEPTTVESSTAYILATRSAIPDVTSEPPRKKIKIKSVVRKRPPIQTSIIEQTQLESSFLFDSTPVLTSSTEYLPDLTSPTILPTKQLKRLKVTVRKKASKLIRPVPETSSAAVVHETSSTPAEVTRTFQAVTKSGRGRLRASKIISRRVRPSDLIRQSPVFSVTPVAFTTTTRLPIEVSGSTEFRDVELTTFSLVTSTITPSFFPPSPHLMKPMQASPVVLTYFTTTTYTIPMTQDGVIKYTTSEHTNSRVVTQYSEPSSLQPSLVLDAALVNELQTPRISDFETKTMYTTYTYYTTYFVNGSSSVTSSLNIISNTIQVPVLSSIVPTPATPLTILKTSERLKVSTSYSTFTFYATLFNGTSSLVTPFEEVQSQVFTLTESFVVTRTVSIAPTSGAVLPSGLLQNTGPEQLQPEPTQASVSPSFTLFTLAQPSTTLSRQGPLVPSVKTFLTTFTYFTTFFRQSSSYVVSKESVVTSYATLFVDQAKLKTTTTKRPVTSTSTLDTRFPYTTYTSYTTYTFYTTLFGGKDKIIISSEQVVPQVVTKRLDEPLPKITSTTTTTTTQYSTYTAPPVTDDLAPSRETQQQQQRKPIPAPTPTSEPPSTTSTPISTSTSTSSLTYEIIAEPTEFSTASPPLETSTSESATTETSAQVPSSSSTVATIALPEIIIRDHKPTTISIAKKSSTVSSTPPLTTLPYTQTMVLSSSTRFFGRDRRLTHIGAGSTLLLITGSDGLLTRSQAAIATESPTSTVTATTATTIATSAAAPGQIAPSSTQPGTILDLTDILGGKGGKLGEAIKGIVNLFTTKNSTTSPDATTTKISREDSSLPVGPVMVSSREPLFIPLSPVLDISSFIKPATASKDVASASVDPKLTPIYKPDEAKEGKELHIPLEKLMSDISRATTKTGTAHPTVAVATKKLIPSTTIRFGTTPSESVSVIVGAETIFFDEGTNTDPVAPVGGASTTAIRPTFVHESSATPSSKSVIVTPEVSVDTSHEASTVPGSGVEAQSSVVVVQPTVSVRPVVESTSLEQDIRPSKPTIYFQVSSSTVATEGPKTISEVDYGGVKVFIAGRGSRKPVEPVVKPDTPPSTRKPLPNIFKVGAAIGGRVSSRQDAIDIRERVTDTKIGFLVVVVVLKSVAGSQPARTTRSKALLWGAVHPKVHTSRLPPRVWRGPPLNSSESFVVTILHNPSQVGTRKGGAPTTAKPISNLPKVKISFPKPPPPPVTTIDPAADDLNDIFSAFKPFNSTTKESDGPTPSPLCYPGCDSSRHETCVPNPSKSARNKYICACRPGYTRDPDNSSNRCIASQTFLLPVHLVRASTKGSVQSQMPRLLHALKVSLEQTYSDQLGFGKGSLLDAKVNSVQKVTNYNNESSLVLTLALSQRASNADLSLPSLSEQLARSAPILNASLESLQSPFVLLASSPIDALQDLDECSYSDLNDCSYYARCINVPGSFHCECKSGYQDLDAESPGRTCSSEIKNCQFCSARGSCILGVDNGVEKTTCRCNTMYLGRRCEINGLVLAIALPIALSLLTVTVCCSVRRCRPRYRSTAVKPPLPPTKIAMAYPSGGSLLTSSDKGHSDKTQMISDSSSEGEASQGGELHGWTSHGHGHPHHVHGHGSHSHGHHGPIDGRHTQMSSGGYSGYGDSLAETLSAHPLPSIVIPRVRPKLPARQR
ncbi:hypothetical protein BIW11_12828, partial [Tropilaelaps mercedesae]